MVRKIFLTVLTLLTAVAATAQAQLPSDTITTAKGDLKITFLGYGSLSFEFNGKTIYVDPVSKWADYTKLPKADLILVSQNSTNYLDTRAIYTLRAPDTAIVLCDACASAEREGIVMRNGDVQTVKGFRIEAVPAYNADYTGIVESGKGSLYHQRGEGNGYVLTIGQTRVYVASDTEYVPEIKALKKIDVAFLPLSLPNTMTPERAADAAKAIKPKILYPYAYWREDPQELVRLLSNTKGIDVRIRSVSGITGAGDSGWDTQGITKPDPNF